MAVRWENENSEFQNPFHKGSRPILIEHFCGDNLKLAREEDVMDAVERAAKAVDAFTREW